MFNLLTRFAEQKSQNTSRIYKIITFLYIENQADLTIKDFILKNIAQLFSMFNSMPLEIFLQPYLT